LNAEHAWNEFLDNIAESQHSDQSGNNRRYIRINPELRKVPKLDEKAELADLEKETIQATRLLKTRLQIESVAHRLIASCFYYERTSPTKRDRAVDRADVYYCEGT
jgi:hypothetical protein